MSFKNAARKLFAVVKNPVLKLLKKWKYWPVLNETAHWSFTRLPPGFTIPLASIAVAYFVLFYPVLVYRFVPWLRELPAYWAHRLFEFGPVSRMGCDWLGAKWTGCAGAAAASGYRQFLDIVSALLTLTVAAAGIVVSHSLACFCYRCWHSLRRRLVPATDALAHSPRKPTRAMATVASSSSVVSPSAGSEATAHNPLKGFERIGIILAGGGAKGAYQAGAMKAVYEFIEEHGARDKVRMIAGTSIGSWNALFWLADMVKDEGVDDEGRPLRGPLERWWRSVKVPEVIKPVTYLPTRQNFFLSNEPWQESFDRIFSEHTDAGRRLIEHMESPNDDGNINFYFTCTNIKQARLEVTTNENERVERRDPYLGGTDKLKNMNAKVAKSLAELRFGVFSSMDLPPLFDYASPLRVANGNGTADYYEDGGVIDNLPIYFGTEVEECDLLFILPLNASFEQDVNHKSLIKRLARVMNVRQGVLERKAFKDVYLFNESAYLRVHAEEQGKVLRALLGFLEGPAANLPDASVLAERARGVLVELPPEETKAKDLLPLHRALRRRHKPVQIFSICPKPEPKLMINTAEFWKTREAGLAFDRMYKATKDGLKQRFEWLIKQNYVTMVQVPDEGDPSLFTDF